MSEERELSRKDYPLGQHHASEIRSRTGVELENITLAAIVNGDIGPEDLTIHRDTLEFQASIAEESGYGELGANLRRAAELTNIPNERLLDIYEALRPGRSTYYQLLSLSQEIAGMYAADETARYIREAADAYRDTGMLKIEE